MSVLQPICIVYFTDAVDMCNFERHLDMYTIQYSLHAEDSISVPDNIEILACQAAAEGKSVNDMLPNKGDSTIKWTVKDKLMDLVKKQHSYCDGLAKVWAFVPDKHAAVKLYDACKTRWEDTVVCIHDKKELVEL